MFSFMSTVLLLFSKRNPTIKFFFVSWSFALNGWEKLEFSEIYLYVRPSVFVKTLIFVFISLFLCVFLERWFFKIEISDISMYYWNNHVEIG